MWNQLLQCPQYNVAHFSLIRANEKHLTRNVTDFLTTFKCRRNINKNTTINEDIKTLLQTSNDVTIPRDLNNWRLLWDSSIKVLHEFPSEAIMKRSQILYSRLFGHFIRSPRTARLGNNHGYIRWNQLIFPHTT